MTLQSHGENLSMFMKSIYIALILSIFCLSIKAHGSWQMHAQDMYDVFQFEDDQRLTEWMHYISSELIDHPNSEKVYLVNGQNVGFYDYLKAKYPGFKCKHRLLLHWGYNSRPWTPFLEDKVNSLGWSEEQIKTFQQDLIEEQKRRNGKVNAMTEDLFGFEHGGKEARLARVIVSIAYDTHLLGDYEPDNSDLEGLQEIGSVIADIINNIRALDKEEGKELIKKIQKQSKESSLDVQYIAQAVLNILKDDFSALLQSVDGGSVKNHIEKQGFRFGKRITNNSTEQTTNSESNIPTINTKKEDSFNKTSSFLYIIFGVLVVIVVHFLLIARKKSKNQNKLVRSDQILKGKRYI